jgi:hypothetical protein
MVAASKPAMNVRMMFPLVAGIKAGRLRYGKGQRR